MRPPVVCVTSGKSLAKSSESLAEAFTLNPALDGIVTRTVTASVPVRVDYELTPLGRELQTVVRPLKIWAEGNMHRVLENRERASA